MADLDSVAKQVYKLISKSATPGSWLEQMVRGMETSDSQSYIVEIKEILSRAIESVGRNFGATFSDSEYREIEGKVMEEIKRNSVPSRISYKRIFSKNFDLTDMVACEDCGWVGNEGELVHTGNDIGYACPNCSSDNWNYMRVQENVKALPIPEDLPKAAMKKVALNEMDATVYAYNYVAENLDSSDADAVMDGFVSPHMEDLIIDGLEKGYEMQGEDFYSEEAEVGVSTIVGWIINKLMGKPFPWETEGWQFGAPRIEVASKYTSGLPAIEAWFIRRKKLSPLEHYRRVNEIRKQEVKQKRIFDQDEALRKYRSLVKPKPTSMFAHKIYSKQGGYEVIEPDPIDFEGAPEEFRNKVSVEEGGFAPVFNAKIRKRINKRLRDLGTYFDALPIGDVWKIIEEEGGNPYGLDGIYTGDSATIHVPVAKNSSLFFQWYKLESTRSDGSQYEVVMYVG